MNADLGAQTRARRAVVRDRRSTTCEASEVDTRADDVACLEVRFEPDVTADIGVKNWRNRR